MEVLILNKNDIKRILMSLRNMQNENQVNYLLGTIDLLSEEQINTMLVEIGYDEESIICYFRKKLNQKEKTTFTQARNTLNKVLNLLEEKHLKIYIVGGLVPYILLNQDSNRLHDDIDTICRLEDIKELRELFIKEGLYNKEWDSKTYSKDDKDYGFEMKIEGVPFAICPFEYKDGIINQYSFDPYTKECKTKTIPIKQISDYVYSYESKDGKIYDTMSLEYIKLTKDNIQRPKDILDLEKISEYGIRNDVMSRLIMYKEQREIFE